MDRDGLARHARVVAPLFALAALAAVAGFSLPLGTQLSAALVLALALGLPHGAIDHETARPLLGARLGRAYAPAFAAGYLALAGATLVAWLAVPPLGLSAFLAVSVWHFGLSDVVISRAAERASTSKVLARGLLPIALPGILHAGQIAPVYETLLLGRGSVSAELVQRLSLPLGAAALIFSLATLERGRARDGHSFLRLGALLALCALLLFAPPLLGFALYFCGWHAARETLDLASKRPGASLAARLRSFAGAAWLFSLLAALGFVGVLAWLGVSGSWADEARVLFIGLACLTVPHMIVETMAETRLARPSGPEALRFLR